MTIILDTEKKTVAVKEDVFIKDLIAELKAMLPDGLWEDLTLVDYNEDVVKEVVIISNPVQYVTPQIIPSPTISRPHYPWVIGNKTETTTLVPGVYQIDTTPTPADSLLTDV